MNQGLALNQMRAFARSDAAFAQATRIYAARFGLNDRHTAIGFHNRAFARFESGALDQAVPLMQRAVTIYARVLEGDHPKFAEAQLLLGRIYAAEGRGDDARAAFDRAGNIFTRLNGPDNSAVGDVHFYTAEAEANRGRIDEAMRHVAIVKRIYDKNYGADDPDQAELLLLRSRILAKAGRFADARTSCNTALELQSKLNMELAILRETRATCLKLH